jgi:hypothetical protein
MGETSHGRTARWDSQAVEDPLEEGSQEEEAHQHPFLFPPAPVVPGGRGDKLVGNPPLIFKGDRDKAEEFIMQWQLYEGVNITNDLMRNAYQQAMLFLTYIQGPLVNEWVKGVNAWLRGQVIRQRWAYHRRTTLG